MLLYKFMAVCELIFKIVIFHMTQCVNIYFSLERQHVVKGFCAISYPTRSPR